MSWATSILQVWPLLFPSSSAQIVKRFYRARDCLVRGVIDVLHVALEGWYEGVKFEFRTAEICHNVYPSHVELSNIQPR